MAKEKLIIHTHREFVNQRKIGTTEALWNPVTTDDQKVLIPILVYSSTSRKYIIVLRCRKIKGTHLIFGSARLRMSSLNSKDEKKILHGNIFSLNFI